MTSNLPAVRTSTFALDTVNNKVNYAHQLATAGLLPREYQNNPGNVLLAVEYGESLGIAPIAAINGLHIMNGKPTASAGLISALVRRAGHKLRVTGDARSATATIIRADDPDFEFTVTWTMEMAQAAGLLGNATWKKFPASMLKSRAITQVARDACQEALNGVQYTPEELGATVDLDEAGEQIVLTATPIAPERPDRDWASELEWLGTVDAVRALWKEAADAHADRLILDAIAAKGRLLAEAASAATPAEDAAPAVDENGVEDAVVVEDEPVAAPAADTDPLASYEPKAA